MTKNFPEDVLKDLKVKAMLDTGCSPNNYSNMKPT